MNKKLTRILLTGLILTLVLSLTTGCGGGKKVAKDKDKAKLEQQKAAEAAKKQPKQSDADQKAAAEEAARAAEEARQAQEAEEAKAKAEEEARAAEESKAAEEAAAAADVAKVNKVIVGPYANYGKAKASVNNLKANGFKGAFVKEYGGQYWAQIGVFRSAEAANKVLDKAKHKKYDGQIIRE